MNVRWGKDGFSWSWLNPILSMSGQSIGLSILILWLTLGWGVTESRAWADEPSLMVAQSTQPYLDRLSAAVSEFTLDNGMKFIVLERHQVPVVSFMVYANVGAVNERDGKTGVAHYLEIGRAHV